MNFIEPYKRHKHLFACNIKDAPSFCRGGLFYQLFHEEYNLVNFIIQAFLLTVKQAYGLPRFCNHGLLFLENHKCDAAE
jgi:hypothetical protein